MGATQVDRHGNQNISAIGDFAQPKRQLLGSRGAPGNTVNNRTSYWVPKHSPRVFVEQVDIVSGVGPARAKEAGPAAARFNDIHRIVSNLGVFDVSGPGRHRAAARVHPGVTVDEVVEDTGFELDVPATCPTTREPTMEELIVIREVLDPKGLRFKEVPECSSDRAAAQDAAHRAGRRPAPRRPDRHGLGVRPATGQRHRQRRRPRHPGQRDHVLRGAREGDPRGQEPHRPAVRRQPPRRRRRRPRPLRPADRARREGRVVRARAQAGADREAQGRTASS